MKDRIKKLEDERLLEIVGVNRDDYTPEALAAATQELDLRGYRSISNKDFEPSTLKDLIMETSYSEIEKILKRDFKTEFNKYDFKNMYLALLKFQPVVKSTIGLRAENTYVESRKEYLDDEIVAFELGSGEVFNADQSNWGEWLGFGVNTKGMTKPLIDRFVALCLLKMINSSIEVNNSKECEELFEESTLNSSAELTVVDENLHSRSIPLSRERNFNEHCMLKEVILRTGYEKIGKTLKRDLYTDYAKYNFADLYLVLLKATPVVAKSVELRIERTFIESIGEYSDEEIVAFDGVTNEIFNPELSLWTEWLGYSVDEIELNDHTTEKFVSMCLIRIAQNEEEMNAYEVLEGKQLRVEYEENAEEQGLKDSPKPFIRYFARRLDYMLFGSSLGLLYFVIPEMVMPLFGFTQLVSISLILWLLVETVCIYIWGCTPGKYIFSIQIVSANQSRLSFIQAFKRAIGVLIIGMGLGNSVASVILNIFCYFKLMNFSTTMWDKYAKTEVRHTQLNMKRIILGVSIIIMVTMTNVGLTANALAHIF